MDDILGQNVTVRLDLDDDKQRFFNGHVSRFAQTGRSAIYATYQVTVRPWLWFLTRRQDCRIFQEMTVPDIIKKVFRDDGFSDFEETLSGSYRKWEYCVQYRETDFDFVSRLMEQEGIYYYFKHEDGKHTLVMSNDASSLEACPNLSQARYLPESGMGDWEDGVLTWEHRRSIVPGKVTLGDYHFQMSNKTLREPASGSVKVASNDNLE